MAVSSRRRLGADARRAQLIELGLEVLAKEPRESVALDRISERAGISRGLLFHYFPSKRDYHVAVVRAAAGRLLEATEPDPALEVEERLRAGLDSYLDFVEENESLYRSLVRGAAGADRGLQEVFDETRGRFVGRTAAQLGVDRPEPALRLALRGWLAFVEEAALDWLEHRDLGREDLVRVLEACFRTAVETTLPA